MNIELESMRLKQIERRLMEIGSQAKGNQQFTADRISDVVEQIDELRKRLDELDGLAARVDRIADYLNKQKEAK